MSQHRYFRFAAAENQYADHATHHIRGKYRPKHPDRADIDFDGQHVRHRHRNHPETQHVDPRRRHGVCRLVERPQLELAFDFGAWAIRLHASHRIEGKVPVRPQHQSTDLQNRPFFSDALTIPLKRPWLGNITRPERKNRINSAYAPHSPRCVRRCRSEAVEMHGTRTR